MTEEIQEKPVPDAGPGPGQILKQAREKLGLTVADIAGKLHLKILNIEALEADNFDPAVSLTFTKGYLKLYAKHVNVPENVVLEAFARHHVVEKEPAKLQSFSKRVAKQTSDDRLMLITYLIIAVLLAMVVIWWFQQDSSESTPVLEAPTAEPEAAPDFDVATPRNPTPDDLIVSAQREVESQRAAEQQEDVTESQVQTDDLAPQTAETTPAEVEGQGEVIDENQNVQLVFEFARNCWMNLTDATGEAIAYGEKKAGRVMTVTGVSPFEVTLCAPGLVKISYDGVLVDLSGFDPKQSTSFTLPLSQ